jgi:hypothetical protein
LKYLPPVHQTPTLFAPQLELDVGLKKAWISVAANYRIAALISAINAKQIALDAILNALTKQSGLSSRDNFRVSRLQKCIFSSKKLSFRFSGHHRIKG